MRCNLAQNSFTSAPRHRARVYTNDEWRAVSAPEEQVLPVCATMLERAVEYRAVRPSSMAGVCT